jgi:CRISPR system Cascade subunit CasD
LSEERSDLMRDYLVFTLTGSFAAMGDLAGHERRGSWTWPGRSAILGLLSAAKGIRRDGDFSSIDSLSVTVAIFDSGVPLRDYHTVQTIPSAAAQRPQSRPLALSTAGKNANTTITLRDYRMCPLYGIGVSSGEPGGGAHLASLRDALLQPVFSPYIGRKACTLAAPMHPQIVTAESAADALHAVRLPPWWPQDKSVATTMYCDVGSEEIIETRHDTSIDRHNWHFAERAFSRRSVRIAPLEPAN